MQENTKNTQIHKYTGAVGDGVSAHRNVIDDIENTNHKSARKIQKKIHKYTDGLHTLLVMVLAHKNVILKHLDKETVAGCNSTGLANC